MTRFTPVTLIAATLLLGTSGAALAQGSVSRIENGIIVAPAQGPEKAVRLQVYDDSIIRVTAVPTAEADVPVSLMVVAEPRPGGFAVQEDGGKVTLSTAKVRATVDLSNGNITFRDAAVRSILAKTGLAHSALSRSKDGAISRRGNSSIVEPTKGCSASASTRTAR